MTPRYFLTASLILALGASAFAAEDRLYPPPPPPGAASVRVLDVRSSPKPDVITIAGRAVPATPVPSTFKYIDQGVVTIKSPGFVGSRVVQAGNFYTLLVGNKTSVLYREERPPLTQAHVVLYNLSLLDDVSLKTQDGTTQVIPPQSRFAIRGQAVNPLKVGFGVYSGGRKIGSVPAIQLQRGTSFGVIVVGNTGKPRVITSPGPSLAN